MNKIEVNMDLNVTCQKCGAKFMYANYKGSLIPTELIGLVDSVNDGCIKLCIHCTTCGFDFYIGDQNETSIS